MALLRKRAASRPLLRTEASARTLSQDSPALAHGTGLAVPVGFRPQSLSKRRPAMRKSSVAVVAAMLALTGWSVVGAQTGKVAMLLPGSINDQSWNAAGYGGLQKLKEQGFEVAYSENVQAADHIEAMKDYARRGFSPVIGHSGRFLSAAQRVGPEFEKTFFLVGSGSGGGKNVISIDIANEQFGYLVGALAGRMTKTGKVGAVAGLEGLPNMIASIGGFRLGVKSVKPEAEVRVVYLQSMED